MSTAITVTYQNPTETRPGRYRASAQVSEIANSAFTVPESMGPDAAARQLAEKLKWDGEYVRGELRGSYVYVRTNNANSFSVKTF